MQLATVYANDLQSGQDTVQGNCLPDSGLNDIAVRGNIAAGRSSTRNSHRGG